MKSKINAHSGIVSAKRSKNERCGIHSWHPYYAGYSEAFVKSAINYLDLKPNHLILDPWNGSGTTSLVANRENISEIGFDVNSVMNTFSMAKSNVLLHHVKEIQNITVQICKTLRNIEYKIFNEDPLLDFMSKNLCSTVRSTFKIISEEKYPVIRTEKNISNAFIKPSAYTNPIKCFFLSALFITARKLAGYKGGANPTWVKKLDIKPTVKKSIFISMFMQQITNMLNDLEDVLFKSKKTLSHLACYGNTRNLNIKSNSIDAVITSPPYLTRIDYAMSTRPELLIMFDENKLRDIREQTMGAPVIVDKTITPKKAWGKTCNSVINSVQNHSSKAANSYYLPNFLQYFRDASDSLSEICRVLKPNSKALIVVQSSYFKEHEIRLGKIYVEMSKQFPVKSKIVYSETVRGHMAHLNSKSNEYKKDKSFFEEVIELEKI